MTDKMPFTVDDEPFSDLTRLASAIMDGAEQALKKDQVQMAVLLRSKTLKEFGVATNAGEDFPTMLVMTMIQMTGGIEPFAKMVKEIEQNWIKEPNDER